jgi:plasmid stabilization system protein ParE
MNVRYLSVALTELDEAIDFYEEAEAGLGIRFYNEIRNTVDRIRNYPNAWNSVSTRTRRCRTKVFPFGVIYQIRNDEILIVAIAHLMRKPGYWKARLK